MRHATIVIQIQADGVADLLADAPICPGQPAQVIVPVMQTVTRLGLRARFDWVMADMWEAESPGSGSGMSSVRWLLCDT
jgi:hypothetical protein